MEDLGAQLSQVEDQLRSLREEKARAVKLAGATKAVFEAHDDDASLDAAKVTTEAVRSIEKKIELATADQVDLLKEMGDNEAAGRLGLPVLRPGSPEGISGWHEAADKLSLADGRLRVDMSAQTLLRPSVGPPLPTTPSTPTTPGPLSNRWLYPCFAANPFGSDGGDLAATDFVISFSEAELTGVSGVEIPTATDTAKATISPTVALATPTAKTFAVVLDSVPAKIFDSQGALRQLLQVEMGRLLDRAYDAHVVAAIEAASPPNGSTGADLVAQIRNALAAARAYGSEPSVLALTSTDAASLDLSEQPGSGGGYVFRVDLEGSGSPVWSLRVREADVSDPLLVDPLKLGISYLGGGSVLVDPYGPGLDTNQVKVRVETEARFHVRNVMQGAYAIAA